MICEPCKAAGIAYQAGETFNARKAHETCEDPQACPCQHRTGPYVAPVSQGTKIVR